MSAGAAALAAVALALAACGGGDDSGERRSGAPPSETRKPPARPRRGRYRRAARRPARRLPLRRTQVPRALLARIRRGEAAGVIFFGANLGTPAQVRALTRTLRRTPRPAGLRAPLLLMVDQEGGSVQRLPGAPSRSAPYMAATSRPSVALAKQHV